MMNTDKQAMAKKVADWTANDLSESHQFGQNRKGNNAGSALEIQNPKDKIAKGFGGKRFSTSGMDSTKGLNSSKLHAANYDTVNQESKMSQPNNRLNRKLEDSVKENPNKSTSKPKTFVNGSKMNTGEKLKDIKEEPEKMTCDKSAHLT